VNSVTTRSLFKIEQFEKKLQEYAHQIPKFKSVTFEIENGVIRIDFYYTDDGKPRRIRVHATIKTGKIIKWDDLEWEEKDYWNLTIEPKNYTDSPHATKITGENEKALEWLNKLMEGIEPEPRFSLSNMK